MKRGARCRDFAQVRECDDANVENIGKARDAKTGEILPALRVSAEISPNIVGHVDRMLDP